MGPVMPVVYDTPWAGLIDAIGGVSLRLYARLHRWKREAALRHPEESTGFQVVGAPCEMRVCLLNEYFPAVRPRRHRMER